MRPERRETGFGLVAAMFLIVIVALVIAAMARLAVTQNATTSMAIQQARAYQATRAGIEYGIARTLADQDCDANFTLDGFSVAVSCSPITSVSVPEEGENKNARFRQVSAIAQFAEVGTPDYAYRQLTSVVELP